MGRAKAWPKSDAVIARALARIRRAGESPVEDLHRLKAMEILNSI